MEGIFDGNNFLNIEVFIRNHTHRPCSRIDFPMFAHYSIPWLINVMAKIIALLINCLCWSISGSLLIEWNSNSKLELLSLNIAAVSTTASRQVWQKWVVTTGNKIIPHYCFHEWMHIIASTYSVSCSQFSLFWNTLRSENAKCLTNKSLTSI